MQLVNKRIKKSIELIQEADFILIGAGAGLSSAAGMEYVGTRFDEYFKDFKEKYGVTDMYSASFYPFKTQEEHWAQWARHIDVNLFSMPATELYRSLYELVNEKSYFVITTNVESQFVKSGFQKEKVFEVQGNYAYLQCAKACHNHLYYNEELITKMERSIANCKIPPELVPKCPVCDGEMDVNLRHNQFFVQDEKWYQAQNRYEEFLVASKSHKLLLMEFGVGFNTPGIIRYPFERLVFENERIKLIRFNRDYPEGFEANVGKTVSFDEDINQIINSIKTGNRDKDHYTYY